MPPFSRGWLVAAATCCVAAWHTAAGATSAPETAPSPPQPSPLPDARFAGWPARVRGDNGDDENTRRVVAKAAAARLFLDDLGDGDVNSTLPRRGELPGGDGDMLPSDDDARMLRLKYAFVSAWEAALAQRLPPAAAALDESVRRLRLADAALVDATDALRRLARRAGDNREAVAAATAAARDATRDKLNAAGGYRERGVVLVEAEQAARRAWLAADEARAAANATLRHLTSERASWLAAKTLLERQLQVDADARSQAAELRERLATQLAAHGSGSLPPSSRPRSPSDIVVDADAGSAGGAVPPRPSPAPTPIAATTRSPGGSTPSAGAVAATPAGTPAGVPVADAAPPSAAEDGAVYTSGATADASTPPAAAVVPSQPCPDEATCARQDRSFAVAATRAYQRAAAAAFNLLAIHRSRLVPVRFRQLPLLYRKLLTAMRGKAWSQRISGFDGEEVERPGGVLAVLCFYADLEMRDHCASKVIEAFTTSEMASFAEAMVCTLRSMQRKTRDSQALGPRCAPFFEATVEEAKRMGKGAEGLVNSAQEAIKDAMAAIIAAIVDAQRTRMQAMQVLTTVRAPWRFASSPVAANLRLLSHALEARKSAWHMYGRRRARAFHRIRVLAERAGLPVGDVMEGKAGLVPGTPLQEAVDAAMSKMDAAKIDEDKASEAMTRAEQDWLVASGRVQPKPLAAALPKRPAAASKADKDDASPSPSPSAESRSCPVGNIFCPSTASGHDGFWAVFNSLKGRWRPQGEPNPAWRGSDANTGPNARAAASPAGGAAAAAFMELSDAGAVAGADFDFRYGMEMRDSEGGAWAWPDGGDDGDGLGADWFDADEGDAAAIGTALAANLTAIEASEAVVGLASLREAVAEMQRTDDGGALTELRRMGAALMKPLHTSCVKGGDGCDHDGAVWACPELAPNAPEHRRLLGQLCAELSRHWDGAAHSDTSPDADGGEGGDDLGSAGDSRAPAALLELGWTSGDMEGGGASGHGGSSAHLLVHHGVGASAAAGADSAPLAEANGVSSEYGDSGASILDGADEVARWDRAATALHTAAECGMALLEMQEDARVRRSVALRGRANGIPATGGIAGLQLPRPDNDVDLYPDLYLPPPPPPSPSAVPEAALGASMVPAAPSRAAVVQYIDAMVAGRDAQRRYGPIPLPLSMTHGDAAQARGRGSGAGEPLIRSGSGGDVFNASPTPTPGLLWDASSGDEVEGGTGGAPQFPGRPGTNPDVPVAQPAGKSGEIREGERVFIRPKPLDPAALAAIIAVNPLARPPMPKPAEGYVIRAIRGSSASAPAGMPGVGPVTGYDVTLLDGTSRLNVPPPDLLRPSPQPDAALAAARPAEKAELPPELMLWSASPLRRHVPNIVRLTKRKPVRVRRCFFFGLICRTVTIYVDDKLALSLAMSSEDARFFLLRVPVPLLAAMTGGSRCDCLCPVPRNPKLTAEDCGRLANQMLQQAEADSVLSDANGNAFDAAARFRTLEMLAQEAQAIAGPRIVFPDPDPPDGPKTSLAQWPDD